MSGINVNIPYVAKFSADGSLTIETVQHQSYDLAAADLEIQGYMLNDLFKAFKVSDEVSGSMVQLAVNMNGDLSSNFLVALRRNLEYAPEVDPATGAPAPGVEFLQAFLERIAREKLKYELQHNGVAAALEAADMSPLEITNFEADASAGAADMWQGLNDLAPNMRALIATQIPNANYISNYDVSLNAEVIREFLPLRGGDTLTFQFVISQNYEVTESVQPGVTGSNIGAGEGPNQTGVTTALGSYAIPSKTVNIVMRRIGGEKYPDLCGAAESFYVSDVSGALSAMNNAQVTHDQDVSAVAIQKTAMDSARADWVLADASYNAAVDISAAADAAEAKYQELRGQLIVAVANANAAAGTPQYTELLHIQQNLEAAVAAALTARNTAAAAASAVDVAALLISRDTAKSIYDAAVVAYSDAVSALKAANAALADAKAAYASASHRYESLQLKRDAAMDTAQFNVDNAQILYNDASGAAHEAIAKLVADLATANGSLASDLAGARTAYIAAATAYAADKSDTYLAGDYTTKRENLRLAAAAYDAGYTLCEEDGAAVVAALDAMTAARGVLIYWQAYRQITENADTNPAMPDPALPAYLPVGDFATAYPPV